MIRIMASCHSVSPSDPFSKDRERADDRRALDPLQGRCLWNVCVLLVIIE